MKIGRLSFGRRPIPTTDFRWFYCPFLKNGTMRKKYHFFVWIGRRGYIALKKRGAKNV